MAESLEVIDEVLSEAGFPKKSVLCDELLNTEYESFSFYINQKQYRHRRGKRTPNKKGYFSVFG